MTTINCPVCGHDIDGHCYDGGPICWDCDVELNCRMQPSDIARALLTAEPTDAGVRAANVVLNMHGPQFDQFHTADRTPPCKCGMDFTADPDGWAELYSHATRAAIIAARKAQTNA